MFKTVFVVEDTFQFDGGSWLIGIFTNSNDALIAQQKERRRIWEKQRTEMADKMCKSIQIREIPLNKEIEYD